jgi:hypothetical protein
MKLNRLSTKVFAPLVAVMIVLVAAALLVGCEPTPATPTSTLTPTNTPTLTQTPTPTVTLTPSPTPDPRQQPPRYRLVTPEFSYQFLDLPESLSGQQAIVYWNKDAEWESPNTEYFEYLTLDGARGMLLRLDFPYETRYQYKFHGGHSLVISRDEREISYYVFDLRNQSVLGFAFAYGPRQSVRNEVSVGEEYIALWYIGRVFFIPRSDPEHVVLIEVEEVHPERRGLALSWQNGMAAGWDYDEYCIFDIRRRESHCLDVPEYSDLGRYASPDGQWLEIRLQNDLYKGLSYRPEEIGLLPLSSCLENLDVACEPARSFSVLDNIMRIWWKDCRGIDNGVWTPDSQRLLFLTGVHMAIQDECPAELTLTQQELWRYDLQTDTMEKIGQYEVEYDDTNYLKHFSLPFWWSPPIWAPDGEHFVVLASSGHYSDVYLVSSEDGEMTLIGEIPARPMGIIQLP